MSLASKKKKIFDGRYEILSIVGRGAQSVVYHARHATAVSSEVALKVLLTQKDGSSNSDRLRREALAMVSSRHKYVIRLDDFHSVGDLCYLSMEFAPEADLRKYLSKIVGGRLTPAQAELFLLQSAEALDFIHRAGIIHRDMKPDNILVINDKEIRLGDFGVAVLPGEESSLAELSAGIGTMSYMAPEVLEGTRYDHLADIYSLGVSFYEMLSGVHPFEKAPLIQQMDVRRDENIPDLAVLVPGVPEYLANAITKAMSFEPSGRFQTAKEFAQEISAHRAAQGGRRERKATLAIPPQQKDALAAEITAMKPEAKGASASAPSAEPTEPVAAQSNSGVTSSAPSVTPSAAEAAEAKRVAAARRSILAKATPLAQAVGAESVVADPLSTEINNEPAPAQTGETMSRDSVAAREQSDEAEAPEARPGSAAPAAPSRRGGLSLASSAIQAVDEPPPADPLADESDEEVISPFSERRTRKNQTPPAKADEPGAGEIKGASGQRPARKGEPASRPGDSLQDAVRKMEAKEERERSRAAKADAATDAPLVPADIETSPATRDHAPLGRRNWRTSFILAASIMLFLAFCLPEIGRAINSAGKRYLHVDLGKILTGHSSTTDGTSPIPSYAGGPLAFPALPAGLYFGQITGLVPQQTLPLTIISFSDKKKVAVIVGIEGWTPAWVSLGGDSSAMRVSSNGYVLDLSGQPGDGELKGEVSNKITGEKGAWHVAPAT